MSIDAMTARVNRGAAEPQRLPASIAAAIASLQSGRPILIVGDPRRTEGGALVFGAEHATPELVARMVRQCSGFVRVAISEIDADRLGLPPMAPGNGRRAVQAIAVDAKNGVTTGISARDRSRTIRLLANPSTTPSDLTRPGHVVPIRVTEHGVVHRPGIAEAAADLMTMASMRRAAAFSDVVSEHRPTDLADPAELKLFGRRHELATITVAEVLRHRAVSEALVERVSTSRITMSAGDLTMITYRTFIDRAIHAAFVIGSDEEAEQVCVRVETIRSEGPLTSRLPVEIPSACRAVGARRPAATVILHIQRDDPTTLSPRGGRSQYVADQILNDLGLRSIYLRGERGATEAV